VNNKKITLINRLSLNGKAASRRGFLPLLLSASLACSLPAAQAAGTWNGGGGVSEFTTPANWIGGSVPASPYDGILMSGNVQTTVTFASNATFTQTVGATPALLFDSTSTGSFTFGGTGTLTVNGVNVNAFSNTSGHQQTINNDLIWNSNAGFIYASGAGSIFTIGGNINNTAGVVALGGGGGSVVQINGGVSGSGVTVNASGGIAELNGINTYTGVTTIYGGTLKVSHDALVNVDGSLGHASSAVAMGNAALNPTFLTVGALSIARSFSLATGTGIKTIGGDTTDISTYSGTITMGNGAGTAASSLTVTAVAGGRVNFTGNLTRLGNATVTDTLTKTGAGIAALSGTNNYQGTTTVSTGTLLINGTLDNTGANVSVASGATLGGNGTINRSGSLAAGGILSAGDMVGTTSQVGTLAFGSGGATSGLTMLGTSVLKFDLQQGNFTVGGGINDLVTVGGNLTLDGTLQVTELGGSLTNGTYRLFSYTGTLTDNTLAIDSAFLTAHAGSTIDTSVANQINLLVVPEPATLILLTFSLTTVMILRRRCA